MARECPNGDCVIGKTQQFLAVLKDPKADRAAKVEALKYVVHFVGDMHQPLHDEDDNDKGGNERRVTLEGKADNLHWAWDTWLIEQITAIPRRSPCSWKAGSPPKSGQRGSRAASGTGFWKVTGSRRRSPTGTWGVETRRPSRPPTSSRRTQRSSFS
ncbi:MAG TPA: S1/P1 nuclease [Terriglobales bacterium]